MYEAVKIYTDMVLNDAEGRDILVEHKFDLSSIHPGLFGTADAVVYFSDQKLLRVYDLKYGKGIIVDAENNVQAMYYALGALLSLELPCDHIEVIISQPRVEGSEKRWKFDAIDIVEFASELKENAKKTEDPNAPLSPGNHCRFCPAAGICPALRAQSLAVAQTEFSPALSYDPNALSETLSKLDMLEAYAKSVREFAYRECEHGRKIPGWKLVEKRATRKWRDEAVADSVLERSLLHDERYETKLKSPAQIEKINKNLKKVVEQLTVAVSSGLTLVPDSEKRPSKLTTAQNDFDLIET